MHCIFQRERIEFDGLLLNMKPITCVLFSEENVKKVKDVAKEMSCKMKDKAKEFVKKVKGTFNQ